MGNFPLRFLAGSVTFHMTNYLDPGDQLLLPWGLGSRRPRSRKTLEVKQGTLQAGYCPQVAQNSPLSPDRPGEDLS